SISKPQLIACGNEPYNGAYDGSITSLTTGAALRVPAIRIPLQCKSRDESGTAPPSPWVEWGGLMVFQRALQCALRQEPAGAKSQPRQEPAPPRASQGAESQPGSGSPAEQPEP